MPSTSGSTGDADEAQEQIAFADVVLVNKTDLVTDEELAELEKRIRAMNAMAKIYRTRNAELAMDALLGVKAFDLNRALEIEPDFLGEHTHEHDESVTSVAIVESGAIDRNKFSDWMEELLRTQGPNIFRTKGILNVAGDNQRFVFQGVHMVFDGRPDRPWKATETPKNELVFIGRDLNENQLRDDFRKCLV
ncbi:CobW family GTP-binding protein [Microcoleus vaginatus]|uniref:CobW family GTP-binding protein n=1 Tax=Microcoleus vaginatus TaxID=119532 RepID=UPI00403FB061